jgi:ATP-dependent exoDNAse (exonuclease V) alpha subunit
VCPIQYLNSVKGQTVEYGQIGTLQQTLGDVKLIIIDECSMTGLKMLGQIQETFQLVNSNSLIMGGVHFIMLGDFYQLDPVSDTQMFKKDSASLKIFSAFAHKGVKVYESITMYHELTTQKRQTIKNDDEDQFREVLTNCRIGESTSSDLAFCNKRIVQDLNDRILKTLDVGKTLYVSPTNQLASDINFLALKRLHTEGKKIINVWAHHKIPTSLLKNKYTDAQVQHFKRNCMDIPGRSKAHTKHENVHEPLLQLAVGSRVMCTKNLATECGCVNGALGVVEGFIYLYDDDAIHPIQPNITDKRVACLVEPMIPIVLVSFDQLTERIECPSFSRTVKNLIPICATTTRLPNYVDRLQLPLSLATCITIHKSQGQSIDNLILVLSKMS